jgi:putative peptidoglycan lipid II flippase
MVVSFFTLLSRVFGFARDVFFAKYLGTGYVSEAFFMAYKIPNFFRNLFAEGVFYSSFVPLLSTELTKKDENNSLIKNFSRNIFSLMLYFLFLLTIIMEISMPVIIKTLAPTFINDLQKYSLTIQLSRIMFPFLIIVSLSSALSAILNCYNKFAITSSTPIILNISFIFFSVISSFFSINVAHLLSIALLIGGLTEFFLLFYFTFKQGIILYPKTVKIDSLTKNFLTLFSNGIVLVSIIQLNSVIDSVFATSFAGAIVYIYYADRLTQLPLTLIGAAISKTILPTLSQKIILQDENRFKLQEDVLFCAIFLGLPCAIGLFYIADIAIPFLFQSGKFTTLDSQEVIACVKILSLAIPNYIVAKIFHTIFFANKDTRTPLLASIVSLTANVVFNMILIRYYGYLGIVISTLLGTFLNVGFLLWCLIKKRYIKFSHKFLINMLKLIYPVIFMILTMILCDRVNINIASKIQIFLKLCLMGSVSGVVFIGISLMLELVDLRTIFRKNV